VWKHILTDLKVFCKHISHISDVASV